MTMVVFELVAATLFTRDGHMRNSSARVKCTIIRLPTPSNYTLDLHLNIYIF